MIIRFASRAIATGLLLLGVTITPSTVRAQGTALPQHSAVVTLAGCLQQVEINGKYEYVLGQPTFFPASNVGDPNCTTTEGAIRLEHIRNLDGAMAGRWIEITGVLEKYDDSHELRELRVDSARQAFFY